MSDTAWKAWERQVAKDHGGVRTGPRGFGLPDVVVDGIAPECKYMRRLSLRAEHMDQARENALRIGKAPVLFLKEAGRGGRRVVVLDYDLWLRFWPYIKEGVSSWLEATNTSKSLASSSSSEQTSRS